LEVVAGLAGVTAGYLSMLDEPARVQPARLD
jgi:hypothetical protein